MCAGRAAEDDEAAELGRRWRCDSIGGDVLR